MSKTFLFFAAQYLPTAGGVERYTYNLAKRVIAAGNEAVVVTSALPGLPSHEIDLDGIEIFRLPSVLWMGGRFPIIKLGKAFSELTKEVWSKKVDFCVINTYFYPLSLYAAAQVKRRGIKAIAINHGSAYLMTGNQFVALCGKIYEQCAARFVAWKCPDIYGVSGAACAWMKTFGVQTQAILSNAIDPQEVQEIASAEVFDWRAEYNLAKESKIIAFVGRLIPEKGVLALASALPELQKSQPDAVMILAGEGALFDTLQMAQVKGLYLAGKQSYARTLALFAQSDLFCLPTRSEGFACTVLEAAALHCPIATTATGGSPQLLKDEMHGILMSDMSPGAVVSACEKVLCDEVWRVQAADKTYRVLTDCYTWEQVAKQLLALPEN
ncbi:MAG: glycosyltransferase family 4 protein [Faecalibacterium sp.]